MADLSASFNPASVATNSDAASSALVEANAASVTATSADSVLTAWVDQGVKVASSPTFAGIVIADGGTIGQAAGPLVEFDDTNNYLEITGCNVGIGTPTPSEKLHIMGDVLIQTTEIAGVLHFGDTADETMIIGYDSSGSSRIVFNTGATPRASVNNGGMSIGGDYYDINAPTDGAIIEGNVGISTASPNRLLHAEKSSALTNTVQQVARLSHITSGAPANNIGVGLEFEQETTGGNNEVIATIEAICTDVTGASEKGAISLKTMVAGAAATEALRVDASAAAGETRLLLYDVDNATVERVTVGVADSGGAGFKVLRIPN